MQAVFQLGLKITSDCGVFSVGLVSSIAWIKGRAHLWWHLAGLPTSGTSQAGVPDAQHAKRVTS